MVPEVGFHRGDHYRQRPETGENTVTHTHRVYMCVLQYYTPGSTHGKQITFFFLLIQDVNKPSPKQYKYIRTVVANVTFR